MQIIANGVIQGLLFGLVGLGFALVYSGDGSNISYQDALEVFQKTLDRCLKA